jgi:hypothetical protein
MKIGQLLVVAMAAVFVFSFAIADAALVRVSIDGQSMDVPLRQIKHPEHDGFLYQLGYDDRPYIFQTSEGKIELGGLMDPDPSLIFGGAAFDFGAPSSFGFTFILPLSPVFSNPSTVFDSFSGSVTNGAAPGGVTVTALAPPPGIPDDGDGVTEMQVYTLSDDGGLTWKNVGLDQGPSAFIPLGAFASGLYGDFSGGPIATIPGGPWTHMRADINFSLSGGGDAFTFNGAKVLIPEPGTMVLAMTLIAALFGIQRRSRC